MFTATATHTRPLTRKELTKVVAKYARRHGYSASTVRTVTALRLAAIREYISR
jgi:hypothetical protein